MADQTRFGFTWGQVTVERTANIKGHRVLTVKTNRERVDLRVTPSGLIRVTRVEVDKPRVRQDIADGAVYLAEALREGS